MTSRIPSVLSRILVFRSSSDICRGVVRLQLLQLRRDGRGVGQGGSSLHDFKCMEVYFFKVRDIPENIEGEQVFVIHGLF
jgi:hypothetical protein